MTRIAAVLVALSFFACGSRETEAPPLAPSVMPAPVVASSGGPVAASSGGRVAPPSGGPVAAPAEPTGTVMPADVGSLPPRAVCVESPEGALSPATVRASIAGVYVPDQPLLLAHLNWMAPGIGCVTFPGASTRVVACGGSGPAPVVARALCQQ